jgi:hypothetical protein
LPRRHAIAIVADHDASVLGVGEVLAVYRDAGGVGIVGVLNQLDQGGRVTAHQQLAEFAKQVRVDRELRHGFDPILSASPRG